MKSFREQLNFIRDNECNICDIIVADSCDEFFNFEYSEKEFEILCQIAQRAYLKAEEVGADDIAIAIDTWFASGRTISELIDISTWDLINAAISGWDFDYPDEMPWCEGWTSPIDCQDCPMTGCNCNPKYDI